MQSVSKIKSGVKNTVVTALELASVRLEMASVELSDLKSRLLGVVICALLAFILFLFSGISLLFALDAWLPVEQKAFAFFLITGIGVGLMVLLGIAIVVLLRKQKGFLPDTLNEIKQDVAAIKRAMRSSPSQGA
ncbi:phage holin family protein [Pasteurellaceae bacterium 20609_3]|uniref:phage holin family protein n=1 Tax=Spirabiliibacterium mucosae TaxID=28156 RepID=UPI001AAD8854|nr:phage holin family protein [Spirabiliibacterium mucosae]MBE2898944.1 phage holin family protein [Spirabiliibacterium mucosae]